MKEVINQKMKELVDLIMAEEGLIITEDMDGIYILEDKAYDKAVVEIDGDVMTLRIKLEK
jgi:hypothetical protein